MQGGDAELLHRAVREAGNLALTLFRQNVRKWSKSDGSIVTEADLKIDAFLKDALLRQRPHYGWLSEETPDSPERLACDYLWVVDPIDGTQAFASGGDAWCVGVALIHQTRPILAALYRPVVDEFYAAAIGQGASCNGVPLVVRDGAELSGAEIMATGKAKSQLLRFGVTVSNIYMPLLMRLACLASGKTDIAMSNGHKNDWDLAAGDLLVGEAGGRITTIDGAVMTYNKPDPWQNGLLAAGLKRHGAVLAQLETG